MNPVTDLFIAVLDMYAHGTAHLIIGGVIFAYSFLDEE